MDKFSWAEVTSAGVALTGSLATSIFGGWDVALRTLLLLMVIDYITGLIYAAKDQVLNSSTGFKGLCKKVIILSIVALAVAIDNITNTNGLARSLVIFFYASMEGISILENASRAGVPVPDKLKDALEQLKDNKDGE